jgi:hypothetical protein
MKESSDLKQATMKAMAEGAEMAAKLTNLDAGDIQALREEAAEKKDMGDVGITGEDLMQAVTASSVSLNDTLSVGLKLLTSGVGRISGQKFNSNMAADLTLDEIERMVGEYAINFCLKSILN